MQINKKTKFPMSLDENLTQITYLTKNTAESPKASMFSSAYINFTFFLYTCQLFSLKN